MVDADSNRIGTSTSVLARRASAQRYGIGSYPSVSQQQMPSRGESQQQQQQLGQSIKLTNKPKLTGSSRVEIVSHGTQPLTAAHAASPQRRQEHAQTSPVEISRVIPKENSAKAQSLRDHLASVRPSTTPGRGSGESSKQRTRALHQTGLAEGVTPRLDTEQAFNVFDAVSSNREPRASSAPSGDQGALRRRRQQNVDSSDAEASSHNSLSDSKQHNLRSDAQSVASSSSRSAHSRRTHRDATSSSPPKSHWKSAGEAHHMSRDQLKKESKKNRFKRQLQLQLRMIQSSKPISATYKLDPGQKHSQPLRPQPLAIRQTSPPQMSKSARGYSRSDSNRKASPSAAASSALASSIRTTPVRLERPGSISARIAASRDDEKTVNHLRERILRFHEEQAASHWKSASPRPVRSDASVAVAASTADDPSQTQNFVHYLTPRDEESESIIANMVSGLRPSARRHTLGSMNSESSGSSFGSNAPRRSRSNSSSAATASAGLTNRVSHLDQQAQDDADQVSGWDKQDVSSSLVGLQSSSMLSDDLPELRVVTVDTRTLLKHKTVVTLPSPRKKTSSSSTLDYISEDEEDSEDEDDDDDDEET